MELTGKCREEFYEWSKGKGLDNFNPKMFSLDVARAMVFGVYVDYFDSVGVFIEMNFLINGWFGRLVTLNPIKNHLTEEIPTRPQARQKAIEKANEIRNVQLQKL